MSEAALLKRGFADLQWLQANRPRLREEFPEEFVAIKNEAVVAHAEAHADLVAQLEREGIDPGRVLVDRMSSILRIL